MKCQFCNKNEAVNTFLVSFSGIRQEVHLCASCTKLGRQYYERFRAANPGMFLNNDAGVREVGEASFPDNAGDEIRRRRQMNILRARLEQALEDERYEEAARIRDQIAIQQKHGGIL